MAEQIGFVGLGIMGRPMAKNLIKAGYSLTVYDIVGEAVEELATEGAKPASTSSEVAANTDKIITMLPDSADSEKAILGPGGVLEGAKPGSVIIDMSSIAPSMSQKIFAECAEKGVDMLDAPVSGGEPGAINATSRRGDRRSGPASAACADSPNVFRRSRGRGTPPAGSARGDAGIDRRPVLGDRAVGSGRTSGRA